MSQQRGGRFSYLASGGQQTGGSADRRSELAGQDGSEERKAPQQNSEPNSERWKAERSGGEGSSESASTAVESKEKAPTTRRDKSRTRKTKSADVRTVPKGQGRMKQDRSQLNVRIPTALKRQASAKAVLEGREIGEIVEELLREYISK